MPIGSVLSVFAIAVRAARSVALMVIVGLMGCGEGRMSPEKPSIPPAGGPPAGWDDELRLRDAEDLNPDPSTVEIRLDARVEMLELRAGKVTPVWTYNGGVPGPLIRAKRGDRLIVHFTNHLPEATTVHWHGLRVPAEMDGVPEHSQPAVPPGGSFDYVFTLRDAGLFWYHPHLQSAAQVGFGLYGAIIVDGPGENQGGGNLGDELILVLSDMAVDPDGNLRPSDAGGDFGTLFGREGDLLLVNGRVAPTLLAQRGRRQRWRVVNAAKTRYFQIGFAGHSFVRIGGDGGLRETPIETARPVLAPGERADLLITPDGQAGDVIPVSWIPYDQGYGATFGRSAEPLMSVRVLDIEPAPAPAAVPARLRTIQPLDMRDARDRVIAFTHEMIDGKLVLGINGQSLANPLTMHAKIGETDLWSITNKTVFDHPFHLHGFFFQVLDESGGPAEFREWKDTVNVPVDKTIRLAVRYDERPGMWMFHCHILDHADAGMMGMLMLDP